MFLTQIQVNNSRILGDIYGVHQKVMAFVDSEERVLYRVETDDFPRILVLSEDEPSNKVDWGKVIIKPYNPIIAVGRRFRFRLLANPTHVVSVGGHKRIRMFLKIEDQENWIKEKGKKSGFKVLDHVLVIDNGFCKIKKQSGFEWITRSVLFEGVLEVSDKNLFLFNLFNGIGRCKAFGFGLLSIAAL